MSLLKTKTTVLLHVMEPVQATAQYDTRVHLVCEPEPHALQAPVEKLAVALNMLLLQGLYPFYYLS